VKISHFFRFGSVLAATALLFGGSLAHAQLIGVQTYVPNGANNGPTSSTLTASQTAGVIPQAHFNTVLTNNASNSSTFASDLVNSAGVATTVNFTLHDGVDEYASGSGTLTPLTANDTLLSGSSGVYNATATYTFSNVSTGTYDLIVYTEANANFLAEVNLSTGTTSSPSTYWVTEQDGYNFTGSFIQGTATTSTAAASATPSNYVEFLNVAPVSGNIVVTVPFRGTGDYAGINGFQLDEVPEPSSYAMMLAGVALLGFCVRRQLA
jgi:hypothetical protein